MANFIQNLVISQSLHFLLSNNNNIQNDALITGSFEFYTGFDHLTVTHQFDDLILNYPTIQRNNIRGNDTIISHGGITSTYPPNGKNTVSHWDKYKKCWSGPNHLGSSSHGNHITNNMSKQTNTITTGVSAVVQTKPLQNKIALAFQS